jgi:hypothetical protein
MKRIAKILQKENFDGGSSYSENGKTREFTGFVRKFRNDLKKALKWKATDVEVRGNHFDLSGNFTDITGQCWYFSISDVRFNRVTQMLVRKCKDYKDYTGESNQYIDIYRFEEQMSKLIGR